MELDKAFRPGFRRSLGGVGLQVLQASIRRCRFVASSGQKSHRNFSVPHVPQVNISSAACARLAPLRSLGGCGLHVLQAKVR
eukprot:10115375-Karenia_brevis.AAC.1